MFTKKACPRMYMKLVLVFYHCATNYQKLSSFKHLPIIIVLQIRSMGKHDWVLSMFLKAEIKVLGRLLYFMEYLEKTTLSISLRLLIDFSSVQLQDRDTPPLLHISLLDIIQALHSAPRVYSLVFVHGSFHFKCVRFFFKCL